MSTESLQEAVDRALAAYDGLTGLGEEIDDEWSYVTDLTAAWRERFAEVVAARGAAVVDPEASVAVERAVDEIGRIADPHRAIDWLSTFPQVVLSALGELP